MVEKRENQNIEFKATCLASDEYIAQVPNKMPNKCPEVAEQAKLLKNKI